MKEYQWALIAIGAGLLALLIIFGSMAYSMRGRPQQPPTAAQIGDKIVAQDVNGCTWAASSDGSTNLVTYTKACRDAK